MFCCVEVVALAEGGYCWHDTLCHPNPARSAHTPWGGAALRIETHYMQMFDCMSATLAATAL